MFYPARFFDRWWLLIPLCAVLFTFAISLGQVRQMERIRDYGRDDSMGAATYAQGRHWLVAPEHNTQSYQWMLETEQMLLSGEWRVRHIDYENAPAGRAVHAASPYRWWLALVARVDHSVSGRPSAHSVEQAALWAGPALHLLVLVGSTVFAARRFGARPAAALSLMFAVLFPLAGEFQAGAPDDQGLAIVGAWWCVLFLAAGLKGHPRSFVYSGIAGGLSLWVDVSMQVPVLTGIGVGALLLAFFGRFTGSRQSSGNDKPLPWNHWALPGAVTSLFAYLLEYAPGHLEMRLEENHPIYGIAWIGLGQLLSHAEAWRARQAGRTWQTYVSIGVALAGLAALPVAMTLNDSAAFLIADSQANRLTHLPNVPMAPNLAAWLNRDGAFVAKLATLLPFALLLPVGWAMLRRDASPTARSAAVLLSTTTAACVALAFAELRWWAMAQVLLLTTVVTAAILNNWRSWAFVAVCLLPGIVELTGSARNRGAGHFTRLELEGLAERDIAHWLADHSDAAGSVVLAAPERTPGLCFHGNLRGLGSPSWENNDGVAATVRIIGSMTGDEAQALLEQHRITHIVLVSWDGDLDQFVRWTHKNPNDAFLTAMHRWALPPWLDPVAYRLPKLPGFEGQSVTILKVTQNTDLALALSRRAEYFLEMQQAELSAAVNEALKTHPSHLGALIARAQFEKARGDGQAFNQVFATLQQNLALGLDRLLPWDRRVSLAVVLALGGKTDAAREQTRRCLAEVNNSRIRDLNTGALYRLLLLAKAYDLHFPTPELREFALRLLPADQRSRF